MNVPDALDSHVHLWDPRRLEYAWLAGTHLDRPFEPDHLRRDAAGMAGFIFVQADCASAQALDEVRWVSGHMRHWPALRGIVAFAPVELGLAAGPVIDRLRGEPDVRGVRRLLQDEPMGFALAPDFLAGLRLLAGAGFPFDACIREFHLPDVTEAARRVPELRFVLDHLGKPRIGQAGSSWRRDLAALARRPNVVCKLSGLTTETGGQPWSAPQLAPYLRHALDVFGPQRCLFGSDWPVMTLAANYRDWLDTVLAVLADYGGQATGQVMARTARAVYAIADPG